MEDDIKEFECQRCGNCCRGDGIVRVTPEEVRAIAEFLNIPVQECYNRYTIQVHDGYWLKDKPNKDCIFLEGNLCSIHPVKPRQCRDFPWKWRTNDAINYCKGLQKCLLGKNK